MFIHLGGDVTVSEKDVIGIFDLDTATVAKASRDYLTRAEKDGDVVNVTYELPKSFVVCRNKKSSSGRTVYISQLATSTLLKRKNGF